jgi:hypothetical protein
VSTYLTKAVILLGRNLSQEKLNCIIDYSSRAKHLIHKLSLRGKTGWDTRLSTYEKELEKLQHTVLPKETVDTEIHTTSGKRKMYIVQCPKCSKQSTREQYHFQCYDLDKRIKCAECSKFSHIKAWKCNCGILWHTCTVHNSTDTAPQGVASNAEGASSKVLKKTSSKRLLDSVPIEQILDDDLKNEANKAKRLKILPEESTELQQFELRPSMPSPHLRSKFAHLFRP